MALKQAVLPNRNLLPINNHTYSSTVYPLTKFYLHHNLSTAPRDKSVILSNSRNYPTITFVASETARATPGQGWVNNRNSSGK